MIGFIHDDITKTSGIEYWFILETFLFVSQVFAGVAFMMVAKGYKLFSIWNKHKPDLVQMVDSTNEDTGEPEKKFAIIENIFYKRKAADFLHYMKFEAYNFVFHGSFMVMDCLVIYMNNKAKTDLKPKPFEGACMIQFAAHASILVVASYQMHHEFPVNKTDSILPKEVDKYQRGALIGAFVAYCVTIIIWASNSIKTDQLIEMWV